MIEAHSAHGKTSLGSGLLWLPPVMQEVSDRVGS